MNSQSNRLFIQKPGHIKKPGHIQKPGHAHLTIMNLNSLEIEANIDFERSLAGAALSADGQRTYALIDNELQVFNAQTGEMSSSWQIAPNGLNLTLHGRAGLIGAATSNGVQIIHAE
jgi:hypothetical protein